MKHCPTHLTWGGIMDGLHSMGLAHGDAEDFYMAKWHSSDSSKVSRNVYAATRLLMAMYLLAWYPMLVVVLGPRFFFIYFTDWCYTLITLDALLQAILAVKYKNATEETAEREPGETPGSLPLFFKISWVVTYICSATSLTVTLGYWILIYAYLEERLPLHYDLQLHLVNAVYVIASVFIAKRPFKWQHFYFPLLQLTAYVVFSAIYWLAGGRSAIDEEFIYPFLNFRDMMVLFGYGSLLVVATLACHLILWLINLGARKVFSNKRSLSPSDGGGDEAGRVADHQQGHQETIFALSPS